MIMLIVSLSSILLLNKTLLNKLILFHIKNKIILIRNASKD